MATSHEVTCVGKVNGHDGDPKISFIGGQTPEGRTWRIPLAEAVDGILQGRWVFFITADGKRRDLRVTVDNDGSKYLAIKDESAGNAKLIGLPECGLSGSQRI